MAKRRDGLTTRCRYKSDIGMQRWVGLGVISDNSSDGAIDEPTKGSVDFVLAIKSRSDPGWPSRRVLPCHKLFAQGQNTSILSLEGTKECR